jgi:sulfur-carrier protein
MWMRGSHCLMISRINKGMLAQQIVKLVYFAWVRERVGKLEESVALPASIISVADLLDWQRGRGEEYAAAFGTANAVRVAIDHVHARADSAVAGAREIAFFPPMTGG